ncbi:glycosyltransferase family 2 protein, partial [Campylobacter fetus]|nr:glycosyltransferase family 2 protein [Campylobacter fetus]
MFSILVSTYNRSGVLKRCLNSILAQTFTQYEVLILDDCSNDDTSEIVKEYTKDSRFKYIRFEKNHSQGVILMNFIVKNKLHKYDYIIGIADDDYISDNFLFKCSKLIKFDPDIISVDSAYSYGGIVTYEPNTYSKNFFSNLQADDINFLKLKVSIVVKTDFYIRNDFYKIQNGEVCEVPYHKYYRFATFGYANGAKYIFESHAGNRRKYTNIFNWIIAIASLCMKNAIYNNIFNKNDFIRFW